MFIQRKSIALAGCLLSAVLFANRVVLADQDDAQDQHRLEHRGYTLASIEGDYAVVGTYSGGIAGLIGVSKTDKNGNIEGSALVNIPGAANTRQVVPISWTGTQTVNEDGTGMVSLFITLPNATQTITQDVVITKAVKINGVKKATEMRTMQRQPSGLVNGEFITDVLTRRPE